MADNDGWETVQNPNAPKFDCTYFVRRAGTTEQGYDGQALLRELVAALDSFYVRRGMKDQTAKRERHVLVLATRCVLGSSDTEAELHFTARIFVAQGNQRYIGGLHAFPETSTLTASFWSADRTAEDNRWRHRVFGDVAHNYDPLN